jgi:hypothetical protein
MRLCSNLGTMARKGDVVYTDDTVAAAIVDRYRPSGTVLDPCRGKGVFWNLMPGAEWCEVEEGRDFFLWDKPVDWIVGNPPYSIFNKWLEHSFSIAKNVVYLLPVAKVFGSRMRLKMIKDYGGIVDIWAPWTGRQIGFDFGWAVGSVHFQRNYGGLSGLYI